MGAEVGFGAGAVNRDGEHIYGGGLRERVQAAMRGWGRKCIGAGGAIGGLGVQVGLWGGLMVPWGRGRSGAHAHTCGAQRWGCRVWGCSVPLPPCSHSGVQQRPVLRAQLPQQLPLRHRRERLHRLRPQHPCRGVCTRVQLACALLACVLLACARCVRPGRCERCSGSMRAVGVCSVLVFSGCTRAVSVCQLSARV